MEKIVNTLLLESTNSSGAGFMYLQRNTDGKSYVLNQSYHPLISKANNLFNQLYLKENGNVIVYKYESPEINLQVQGGFHVKETMNGDSWSDN